MKELMVENKERKAQMLIFMGKLQQEKQDKALMENNLQQDIDELK